MRLEDAALAERTAVEEVKATSVLGLEVRKVSLQRERTVRRVHCCEQRGTAAAAAQQRVTPAATV